MHSDVEPQREVMDFGELTIDISGHKVLVNGEEVDLTASEFKLLTTLCRYPGQVYSRMELVEKVLGYDFEGYETYHRLARKELACKDWRQST